MIDRFHGYKFLQCSAQEVNRPSAEGTTTGLWRPSSPEAPDGTSSVAAACRESPGLDALRTARFCSEKATRMNRFCALVAASSAGGIPASYLVKTNPASIETARTATLPMIILVLLLVRLYFLISALGLSSVSMRIPPFSRRADYTPHGSRFLQLVYPRQRFALPMPRRIPTPSGHLQRRNCGNLPRETDCPAMAVAPAPMHSSSTRQACRHGSYGWGQRERWNILQ